MIRHLLPVIAAAALVVGLTVRPVDQAAAIAAPAASQPFATWEVPREDISSLGTPRSELLVKAFSPTMDPVAYLDEAARFGQKVVLYFRDTVDDSRGTISTSRIGPWVAKVRHHPALWGYLTVKEPSWSGISVSEMRSLRKAFRTADPDHPTVALLGDIPNFGTSDNPWASGIADVLWVDWYPVTFSRGYIATARTHFPKVRAYVDKVTPGTPVWLMVQGHEYRPGDRRAPTGSELEREVLDGARYLHADGFIFYTYHNALYGRDLERNGSLWSTARSIMARTRAGTFLPPNSDPSDPAFRRLAGADRYATAAAISAASFANGAPVAYLATGANFPDALAGAVAAARAGGPLLLTTTDVLPTPTANELHRLAPGRIVVLGSSGVVGNAIVTAVKALLPGVVVTRLAGADRYATAAAISAATFANGAPVAYLATGANFPDALAGAVAAARAGGPLLLTTTDVLPTPTANELHRLAPGRIVVLGSSGVVGNAIVTAVKALLPGVVVTRLAGADRYATAAAISAATFANGAPVAYLATGANFPDALAGAVAAARAGGPLLLTTTDVLPTPTANELHRLAPGRIVVLGSSGVVSFAVAHAAMAAR